jgi:hypothetical protein
MVEAEERQKGNLEHARWRVEFLLCLLDAHHQLPAKQDEEWQRKEKDYIRQLSEAQVGLDQLERIAGASDRQSSTLAHSSCSTTS